MCYLFFLVLIDEVDPCCSRWPGGPENSMHELVMTSVDAFPKQWEWDLDLPARIGGSLELVED
jgi:hypothetical protein